MATHVQVLEKLYRAKWTKYDGLGALVISPTRELALQVRVACVTGQRHASQLFAREGSGNLPIQKVQVEPPCLTVLKL